VIFSAQQWFCNACGKEQFSIPHCGYGREYRCCDKRCYDEMMMRAASSTLGLMPKEKSMPGTKRENSVASKALEALYDAARAYRTITFTPTPKTGPLGSALDDALDTAKAALGR